MKTDLQLQRDVQEQLVWDPTVAASQIGVMAKDSVVTLTGSVPSYAEKLAAERVAKRFYGVRAVANDIEVKILGVCKRNDTDIAAAALAALQWDNSVPDERVKVTVRDGWITLEGEMEWQYQRKAAEEDVEHLIGVRGVTNKIVVKTKVKSGDVKQKIEAAFRRSVELDARRVGVEAQDGKVILHGNVRSWAERDEAVHAAWAAPGVTAVENHIIVTR